MLTIKKKVTQILLEGTVTTEPRLSWEGARRSVQAQAADHVAKHYPSALTMRVHTRSLRQFEGIADVQIIVVMSRDDGT